MRTCIVMVVAAAVLAFAPAAAAATPTVERVTVASFDGVELGGWLIRPADAGDRRLPTVLISTPYIGQCIAGGTGGPCWPAPETPQDWAEHPEPVEHLVANGYAVAWFSVRGTGASGGCWDDLGPREQRDAGILVDWVADQPWSNGRVGAMGLSYMSQTALSAAAARPHALKTVVVSGINYDLYRFFHSPQGLAYTLGAVAPGEAAYATDISFAPPGVFRPNPPLLAARLAHHHERVCPEVAGAMTEPTKGAWTGDRAAEFWRARSLTDRLRDARASLLVTQGFGDMWQSGHAQQDDTIWSLWRAPKAMYTGQWRHTYPWQSGHRHPGHPLREDLKAEWLSMLVEWLDHELKGGRRPEIMGRVRFEEEGGRWHESAAWPPRESREQALFLQPDESLAGARPAIAVTATFRSYPHADRATMQEAFVCPSPLDPALGRQSLVYTTAPVSQRTVIAGNPMAYLDLASDRPGGGFQVMLYDLAPGFGCADDAGRARARALTIGGADLRFHHGGFTARPFTAGHVRVDLANIAAVLQPGHRLAAAITFGDPIEFAAVGDAPAITVRSGPRPDSSQLVLPVLEGGFGGAEPAVEFPARP